MALWKNTQHSFTAGQLDAFVMGRQDLNAYFKGATILENFIVKRQGCISKRRGTDLAARLDNLLGTDEDGNQIGIGNIRLVGVNNGDDGRYVILSGGGCFVASRNGILDYNGNWMRSINPYVAVDENGKTKVFGGKDKRYNGDTPVDCINTSSKGVYRVTRHENLQSALDSVLDGGVVRLHADIRITSTVTLPNKKFTIDLYGYTIRAANAQSTISTSGSQDDSFGLIVTSTRPGAKFIISVNSGNPIGLRILSNNGASTYKKRGSLTIDGSIDWQTLSSAGSIICADDCDVIVKSGKFSSPSTSSNVLLRFFGCHAEIESGTFVIDSTKTNPESCVEVNDRRNTQSKDVTDGVTTISGGTFVCNSLTPGSWCVDCKRTTDGVVIVNGGRFSSGIEGCFFSNARNSGSQLKYGVKIYRGEFNSEKIQMKSGYGGLINISEFIQDGSVLNDSFPNRYGYYGCKIDGDGDYTLGMSSGYPPYRIAIPYSDEDLSDICIRQCGDTLFLAHRDYPPAKIFFDSNGLAYFEEVGFDNIDIQPPVIDAAEMDGQDAVETDYPDEYGISYNENGDIVYTDDDHPSWLNQTQIEKLHLFINKWKGKGIVTNAGFVDNLSDGSDGSYAKSCSFSMTVENKDYASGSKTTYVAVMSFTSSCTKETTTTYKDGLATGSTTKSITSSGSADNDASATSAIVQRTVKYVVTQVKNGKESRPSQPYEIKFDMPWANNAVVNLKFSKGSELTEPEYYNIYKNNGNGYGLIGTTSSEMLDGTIEGMMDTYPLYSPQILGFSIVNTADLEEQRGWSPGTMLKKLASSGRKEFSSSPSQDLAVISTTNDESGAISISFNSAEYTKMRIMLDARLYDPVSNVSYLLVSTPKVTAKMTIVKDDDTTEELSITKTTPQRIVGNYFFGFRAEGIYEDWVSLPRTEMTAPNGDKIIALAVGEGAQEEFFNNHLREIEFDFTEKLSTKKYKKIKGCSLSFETSPYADLFTPQQGIIHQISFYNSSLNSLDGTFQDDYINPDMTVTPPRGDEDPHFSGADEYPGCVGVYEQRLVFASSKLDPSTIWMSRVADLYNFTTHESIREDDGLELALAATEFPNINHIVMGRDLILFSDGGEWVVSPIQGNALTFKTASAKLQSIIGSSRTLQPIQVGDEIVFSERNGSTLRTINYNYTSDSYKSSDLSVVSASMFSDNPIVSMAYKQHPDSVIECVLKDGTIATLVYMPEQEVSAWSLQRLSGGWKAKEIATPKCIVNGTTEMMILVKKDDKYQIWKVRDDVDRMTDSDQVILDGLHFETDSGADDGELAVQMGDGSYAIGYPIESNFVSIRPEPESGATIQMEIKNCTESELRVINASTFSVKPWNLASGWQQVAIPVSHDGSDISLSEKDVKKLVTGSNNRDGRIHVRHEDTWPLTILSVSNTYQVEYENGENGGGQ